MKLLITLLVVTIALSSNVSLAQDNKHLPFASELKSRIIHYNRATPTLATSGTPMKGAYKELSKKGVKTFIDIRNKGSITDAARAEAEGAGATYYNIPIYGSKGISKKQVNQFKDIYESLDGLVLVNCGSGNRVGALWAAYQMNKGISSDVALKEGRTMGLRSGEYLENDVLSKYCTNCNN